MMSDIDIDAQDEIERLRNKVQALQKDADRLNWIETVASLKKIEIAKSILGTGFEIGEWPSMRVTVKSGTMRDAIDAARQEQ
jgi:hypothetical protein